MHTETLTFPDLTDTAAALAVYDHTLPDREAMFDACQNNADLEAWQREETAARLRVTRPFCRETRNSADKANVVTLDYVRHVVAMWRRGWA